MLYFSSPPFEKPIRPHKYFEYKEILEKLWLNTNEEQNPYDDFQEVRLQEVELQNFDLRGGDLKSADLQNVNLDCLVNK